MRVLATIATVGVYLVHLSTQLSAQEAAQGAGAQVQRGREIADKVCWVCHVTGADQQYSPILRVPGPDFRVIAKRPNTTTASLSAFLHTTHRTENKPYTMPNPMLNAETIAAVVAYIMSLKPSSP